MRFLHSHCSRFSSSTCYKSLSFTFIHLVSVLTSLFSNLPPGTNRHHPPYSRLQEQGKIRSRLWHFASPAVAEGRKFGYHWNGKKDGEKRRFLFWEMDGSCSSSIYKAAKTFGQHTSTGDNCGRDQWRTRPEQIAQRAKVSAAESNLISAPIFRRCCFYRDEIMGIFCNPRCPAAWE